MTESFILSWWEYKRVSWLAAYRKVRHALTLQPIYPTQSIYPGEKKTDDHKGT